MGLVAFLVPPILILCLAVNTMPFPLPIRSPPPPTPVPGRFVRCRSPLFRFCQNVAFQCPPTCPTSCRADCASCKPVCRCNFPGAVCEDPRFIGGDGITFYFHGRKDRDFCLVSDANLHINGHFIGKRNPNLRRDFTWVQSIGIMFNNHKLLVAAKRTSTWDDNVDRLAISLDGNQISIPTNEGVKWDNQNVSNITITRTSNTNAITLEVLNNFKVTAAVVPITAEDSKIHRYNIKPDEDCFAHLELGFKFFNLTDRVDGILGQTYRSNYVSRAKVNVPMSVMGGEQKYLTSGLFATDCAVSRFGFGNGKNNFLPYPTFNCIISGMRGIGLVCK